MWVRQLHTAGRERIVQLGATTRSTQSTAVIGRAERAEVSVLEIVCGTVVSTGFPRRNEEPSKREKAEQFIAANRSTESNAVLVLGESRLQG